VQSADDRRLARADHRRRHGLVEPESGVPRESQSNDRTQSTTMSDTPSATPLKPAPGQPATEAMLVDLPRLVTAYFALRPDPALPNHRVAFGTSGHRGSSFERTFNEWHVAAITQAI
jgi:hypothetical protein